MEFSNLTGQAYAIETVNANKLIVLYYQAIGEKSLV